MFFFSIQRYYFSIFIFGLPEGYNSHEDMFYQQYIVHQGVYHLVRVRYMHWMISKSYDKTRTTFHHATCRQATFTIFICRNRRHYRHCHHLHCRHYLSSPSPCSSSSLTGTNRLCRNCHHYLFVVVTYGHKPPLSKPSSLTG